MIRVGRLYLLYFDPQTGLLTFEFEFRDGFSHYPELFNALEQLSVYNDKPVIVINSCTFTRLKQTAVRLTQQGIPLINGMDVALRALRNLGRYQTADQPLVSSAKRFDQQIIGHWQSRLIEVESFDEVTSLQLMADSGLPVVNIY